MMMTIPREDVESCHSGRCHEMEVVPGECVYSNPMSGLPRGVLVPWDNLTVDQQAEFFQVRQELQSVAEKLKVIFLTVGDE